MFSPQDWVKRWKANGDRAERNSLMDSGWSASVADECTRNSSLLLRELVQELRGVTLSPVDLFDRPALSAVVAAVHEAFGTLPAEQPRDGGNQ